MLKKMFFAFLFTSAILSSNGIFAETGDIIVYDSWYDDAPDFTPADNTPSSPEMPDIPDAPDVTPTN
jgi:hypothetical protein